MMFHFTALSTSLLFTSVFADYFTNPASFVTGPAGSYVKTEDLTYTFTMGQKVQVTWFSPAVDGAYLSLTLGPWDQSGSSLPTLAAFMSALFNRLRYKRVCIMFTALIPSLNSK
jgi:hypothetical protein